MSMEQAKRQAEQISGVSNVAYDLTALLENKLKGIAAIEEYKQDAQAASDQEVLSLLDQLQQQARQEVDQLKRLLVQRLQ